MEIGPKMATQQYESRKKNKKWTLKKVFFFSVQKCLPAKCETRPSNVGGVTHTWEK